MRRDFVANVSHEPQPRSIVANAETLLNGHLDTERAPVFLHSNPPTIGKIRRLINDLLEFESKEVGSL